MRYLCPTLLFSILTLFTNCSGQSGSAVDAQKLANQIRDKTAVPGESPGTNLYMKAVIDGKQWTADKLIPDESRASNNYRVTGSANGTTIGFYVYIPHIHVGDVIKFSENFAADFITDDENSFYGGRTGKFVVTKLDDQGFEGTFNFTAATASAAKKYEVTQGVLRFPWVKRK
ncbi:MAG TPA: hypothetical protein VGI38_07200 [Puia sp.]